MATAGKKTFIKDLTPGWEGEAAFLVLSLAPGRTNRGGAYLSLELGDRTGRLAAKVWERAEELAAALGEGAVVMARGHVESYRGSPQLIIREARPLNPDGLNWADYLRAAARPAVAMRAEILQLAEDIPDADYRRLTEAALWAPETADLFFRLPAAKTLHHAYLHGLLEHSLSVGRLAARAAGHYPRLNAGLLTAGAILHDIGKVWELSPPPRIDYSTAGRLKGHVALGAGFIRDLAARLEDFPSAKLDLLEHLILSHHGEPEFGAPVRPQLLEAIALHHLDNLDAKLQAVEDFLNDGTDPEGWSPYHRLFGGHFRRTPDLGLEPAPAAPPAAERRGRRKAAVLMAAS